MTSVAGLTPPRKTPIQRGLSSLILSPFTGAAVLAGKATMVVFGENAVSTPVRRSLKATSSTESLASLFPVAGWVAVGIWTDAKRGDLLDLLKLIEKLENLEDVEQLLNCRLKAAELGDIDSMVIVGQDFKTKGNLEKAEEWFEKAAGEHPVAMFELSELLKESDPPRAEKWLRKAAEAGLLQYDLEQIPQLEKEGKTDRLFEARLRAAMLGDADSMVIIAKTYSIRGDWKSSKEWFEKAAALKHPEALYGAYFTLKVSEPAQAYTALYDAANGNHPGAISRLIKIYEEGEDHFKPDAYMAKFWKEKPYVHFPILHPIQKKQNTPEMDRDSIDSGIGLFSPPPSPHKDLQYHSPIKMNAPLTPPYSPVKQTTPNQPHGGGTRISDRLIMPTSW